MKGHILIIAILSMFMLACDQDTEFTVVWTDGDLPANFALCFSDDTGECELNEDGEYLMEKTITYNTCNYASVVRIKAMGEGIDEFTELAFYLRGIAFYGDDFTEGVCSRQDIFCYCPTSEENIDQEIDIQVVIGDQRSNELDLLIKKREEIIENINFSAEVVFISDYQCNPNQNLQPHINIFDFEKTQWNEAYNNLDDDMSAFMPVLFSQGETRSFGINDFTFECSIDLFDLNNTEEGSNWCVAVEDWFCGHSDQDYDYLMTYETFSTPEAGDLRLTFQPVSHFGALNYHMVRFLFETNEPRKISVLINKEDNSGNWNTFLSEEISIIEYTLEYDGRYSFEYLMPSGKTMFQKNMAEALFTVEFL